MASLFHTQTFFKDLDEHCKGLDAILQSGADEDVLVDASLLKEVDSRIKAVQEKSADRLLRLAYENSRSKILGLLDAGRKQLNIQPVKYASQAHVEKALKEYTVSIKWPASDVKMQILLTGPYALENLILGVYDLTWPTCISCALGAPLSVNGLIWSIDPLACNPIWEPFLTVDGKMTLKFRVPPSQLWLIMVSS